ELRRRVRGGDHTAREDLAVEITRRDDVLLRRLAERLDVDVFVEDRVADDQATHSLQGAKLGLQLPEADLRAHVPQIFRGVLGKGLQRAVGETRRAEGDVVGEYDPPAEALDARPLRLDPAGQVVLLVAVFGPLDVDARPYLIDDELRPRAWRDADIVDHVQCREHFRPQLLGEDRPARTLAHVLVGGERDDEDVALAFARLEVSLVADVQD